MPKNKIDKNQIFKYLNIFWKSKEVTKNVINVFFMTCLDNKKASLKCGVRLAFL